MQNKALNEMLNNVVLYKLYTQSLASSKAYLLDEYLADVFAAVWKPLNNNQAQQNALRRGLQRSYLSKIDNLINPKEQPTTATTNSNTAASASSAAVGNSDVRLYALQHLDKIADYLKTAQQQEAEPLNKLHYQQLLKEIERIKDPKK